MYNEEPEALGAESPLEAREPPWAKTPYPPLFWVTTAENILHR